MLSTKKKDLKNALLSVQRCYSSYKIAMEYDDIKELESNFLKGLRVASYILEREVDNEG